jgi:hypothetical protein
MNHAIYTIDPKNVEYVLKSKQQKSGAVWYKYSIPNHNTAIK